MNNENQNGQWHDWTDSLTPETVECVAIKIVHPRHSDTVDSELAVHRQLEAAGESPAQIARLLDSFVAEGHACLVSEMFGEELGSFVDDWELEHDRARQAALDILLGIQALHRNGIVHTDIKPQNVLYCSRQGRAKLIDFSTASTEYQQGRVYGTRVYRPPEFLLGMPWGPPVDIWSTACAIYEMVTGEALFDPYHKAKAVRNWLWASARRRYDAFKQVRANTEVSNQSVSDLEEETQSSTLTFGRRQVLDGRYILVSELGSGHFSTVWKAVRLPEHLRLPASAGTPGAGAPVGATRSSLEGSSSSLDCPYAWKRLYDRCMAFAHFLTMQECLGHFPIKLAREGFYYRAYYTRRKRLKFNPRLQFRPLRQRLLDDHEYSPSDADLFESFLAPMLAFNPLERASIDECLSHPWLGSRL